MTRRRTFPRHWFVYFLPGVRGSQLTPSHPQKNGGVKTKYDRMFNRKSQTILSDHYTKLIDRSDEPSASADGGDDFITLKRADHTLDEDNLPESFHLSKRKLKMGQSKKAMLSQHGNPTKLVFDDEGGSHQIYELAGEDDFKADGDAKAQQQAFVEAEKEALSIADVEDKERAKEKRREKKRKRKDRDGEKVSPSPLEHVRAVADAFFSCLCRLARDSSSTPWTTMGTSRPCSTSRRTIRTTTARACTIPARRRRARSGGQRRRLGKQRSISRLWRCAHWGASDRTGNPFESLFSGPRTNLLLVRRVLAALRVLQMLRHDLPIVVRLVLGRSDLLGLLPALGTVLELLLRGKREVSLAA